MKTRKLLSMLLTAAMLLTLIPSGTRAVHATDIIVSGGENIFYVGTGTQWSGKSPIYTAPQDAIDGAAAWSIGNGNRQAYVLVAVGEYPAPIDSFRMKNGVTIIGGFKGDEESITPTYDQSVETDYLKWTIFDGANGRRVFCNDEGIGNTAALQNAVISGGRTDYQGGGMLNYRSHPVIANCTFAGNRAERGGGMYNEESNPLITGCTFYNNQSNGSGGGMYNEKSSPVVTSCAFTENYAPYIGGNGGGLYNELSNPTITLSSFTGNFTDKNGGGLYNTGSDTVIANCTFSGNSASNGGGLYNTISSLDMAFCAILNNAAQNGGGVYNTERGHTFLRNCTVLGKSDATARGICVYNDALDSPNGSLSGYLTLQNCILKNLDGVSDASATNNNIYTAATSKTNIEESINGSIRYGSGGLTYGSSLLVSHLNADGSLTLSATDAIKQGSYDLYRFIDFFSILPRLNAVYGITLTPRTMRDMKGNLMVSGAAGSEKVDLGAFRYTGTSDEAAAASAITPPAPKVTITHVSDGTPYTPGTYADGPLLVTVAMGDAKDSPDYPFLPQNWTAGLRLYEQEQGMSLSYYTLEQEVSFTVDYGASFDFWYVSNNGNGIKGKVSSAAMFIKYDTYLSLSASPSAGQAYPGDVTLTAYFSTVAGDSDRLKDRPIVFTVGGAPYATVNTNVSGIATCTVTGLAPGPYDFGASYAGNATYKGISATDIENYPVGKGEQAALSIAGLLNTYTLPTGSITISILGGSGIGAVSYTSSNPTVASITGNVVTIHEPGVFSITATKAGDSNYNEKSFTTGLVRVDDNSITLSCDAATGKLTATVAAGTYTYQWAVAGRTYGLLGTVSDNQYTPVSNELGQLITCVATPTGAGASLTVSTKVYKVVPVVSGSEPGDAAGFAAPYGMIGSSVTLAYTIAAAKSNINSARLHAPGDDPSAGGGDIWPNTDLNMTVGAPGSYTLGYTIPNNEKLGGVIPFQVNFSHIGDYVMYDAAFTAEQAGGSIGNANSTGIVLTFDRPVYGLTPDDITLSDGTGAALKGNLFGSGTTWVLELTSVTKQGNIMVGVTDFNNAHIITPPQTVTVYKNLSGGGDGGTTTPEVIGIIVNPSIVNVQKGKMQPFVANVLTRGGASQDVTWSVNSTDGSAIDGNGILTVSAGETASILTVTATSAFNGAKKGIAHITVTNAPPAPEVIGVTVSPNTVNVQKGQMQQFAANVLTQGEASQAVTWSVNSTDGSTIDGNGILTVSAGETASILTVTATSAFDGAKKGIAAVTVTTTSIPKESTPQTAIDYFAETLTGLNGSYSINNGIPVSITGDYNIDPSWFGTTLSIVKKGNGIATTDSDAQNLIIKARPGQPSGLAGVNESVMGANDGKISGVTVAMEYSADGITWTACTGTEVTGLAAGTDYVRFKATATDFYGVSIPVVIGTGVQATRLLTVSAPAFDAVIYGYTQPAAKELFVTNTGNSTATIASVTVSDSNVFEIRDGDVEVLSGDSNNTWKIQPKDGLAAGTYTATITVAYDGGATVTADMSFTVNNATTIYTITFNANGGSVSPARGITGANGKLASLPTPARSGSYTFDDWFTAASGGTKITTDTVFTDNDTIYAHWTYTGGGGGGGGVTTYTVKFEINGGSTISNQSIESGGKVTKPADPTKDGYKFAGWYSDSGLTAEYDFTKAVTGNITIYAKWTENGGVVATPDNTDDEWKNPFVDVKKPDWFYGDVKYVYINGLMFGTSSTPMLFSPNMSTTRAMIVTILYRQEGSPNVSGHANPFDDVPADTWYTDAVIWAASKGIVKGYGNSKFGPDDNITREQMVTILHNFCKWKGIDVSVGEDTNILSYNDAFNVSEWAIPAFQWSCGAGIVSGKPGGLLDPQGKATRAEVAAILHRFLETVK
jgi:uncharacterized repeat protein (TIGR02543 family)